MLVLFSWSVSAANTTCSSCDDCTAKLNGSYETVYLNTSIYNHTETCITFGANNVTFDCQGHSIDGDNRHWLTYGIYANNKENLTVKNCILTDWESGLYLLFSSNNNIINNTASSNFQGINLFFSDSNSLTGNNLANNSIYSLSDDGFYGCNYVDDLSNTGGDEGKPIKYVHDTSGITISNTDEYSEIIFCRVNNSIIDNVTISNPGTMSDGILFVYSNNNTIKNSNLSNDFCGIQLYNSDNNNITGNIANLDYKGIVLVDSDNNNLIKNTADSSHYGIHLSASSDNNNLTGNTVYNSQRHGLYISSYIVSSKFKGNTINSNMFCNSNQSGINWYDIYDAGLNSGSNNTCNTTYNWNDTGADGCTYFCGEQIEQQDKTATCSSCSDCTAKLNGSYEAVYLNTSIYNHTETCITFGANNVTFDCRGNKINGTGTGYGIYLNNKTNNTIINCTVTGFERGIFLDSSSKNTIKNNLIYNNSFFGVILKKSDNNTIRFNEVYNHTVKWNSGGIGILTSSNHNNISLNIVYNNRIDNIELWDNSYYNEIWNNTVYSAEYGILMSNESNNNTIKENKIYENIYGIGIGHENQTWGGCANDNIIEGNIITDNEIGIRIINSSYNIIINNNCSSNNNTGIYSQNSDSIINSNIVCKNTNLDFNSSEWLSSYGGKNACISADGWNDSGINGCWYTCGGLPRICDINDNGIIIHDYNDLMTAYKCFLGITKDCDNYYQNWNLIKQEYNCFVDNTS